MEDKEYARLSELESKHWENITYDGTNILNGEKVLFQWGNHPIIRLYSNFCQTGDHRKDWQDFLYDHFSQFNYGCSVGCGSGWVEQILIKNGIVKKMDAFEISAGAIEEARKANKHPDSLNFTVADFNKMRLEDEKYDFILFHHSFHHLLELEHVIDSIEIGLSANGIIVLIDYIGETRGRWEAEKIKLCKFILELLPEGVTKEISNFNEDFFENNPFEMIRSSEIMPLMNTRFRVLWRSDMGGFLYPLNNTIVSAINNNRFDRFIFLTCIFDALFNAKVKPCFTFSIFTKKNHSLEIGAEKITREKILDFLIASLAQTEWLPEAGLSFNRLTEKLVRIQTELLDMQEENRYFKEQLAEVHDTVGWLMLNRIRHVRDKIFPHGTKRAKTYERAMKIIKNTLR